MQKYLLELEQKALLELKAAKGAAELDKIRIKYMGKKGLLSTCMRKIREVPPDQRPEVGKLTNIIKKKLTAYIKDARLTNARQPAASPRLDVTLPGREPLWGHAHPITLVIDEVCQILSKMGFMVVEGPNVELDYYNFEALNIPKDHPARDMQDTFYISKNIVLRTHTSPIQARIMETTAPPISIIAPGKVYRKDSDVSHTPMFHQIEGLLVDQDINFGDLKGTLTLFLHQMFGSDTTLRFRPSFFPFTEPSAEVDIQCVICNGKGCRTCSHTGWLEILGAGMVDPALYKFVNYDPDIYSGFAFGMGIERIAMLKYGINDIQLFFKNDMRFLKQF